MPPDNITPPSVIDAAAMDASTEAIKRQNQSIDDSTKKLGVFNTIVGGTNDFLGELQLKLEGAGISLKNVNDPTSTTTAAFGLLASSVIGATKSFDGLSNIDTTALSIFSSQIEDIYNIIKTSPGGKIAGDMLSAVANELIGIGAPAKEVNKALNEGTEVFMKYAKSVLTSADNGLRMQNAFLQMSASTGNLGKVFGEAGFELNNMNTLLAQQSAMLKQAGEDTKLPAAELQKYWAQLGTIPGALDEMSVSLENGGQSLNTLSAAVQLAQGSGRATKDVMEDLRTAVMNYGLSTSQAFTFTARIGEVAQKFKAPMADVRSALMESSKAFSMFADAGESSAKQSEGFVNIMNNYVDALKQTGLSAHNAMGLIGGMTNQMSQMGVAQKAFLSQQTGGPGGLRGAFQIEGMLRRGEDDKVFELVRKQMQKQMGSIVTQKDAEGSEAAATQLQKQMSILKDGPLGKFAQTDQQAYRILEAFKGRETGAQSIQGLSKSAAADQVNRGKQIENLSNTPLSTLRATLEGIRYQVNISNLGTMQKAFSAGAGVSLAGDTKEQKDFRLGLQKTTPAVDKTATTGTMLVDNMDRVKNTLRELPDAFKVGMSGLKKAISSGDPNKIKENEQSVREDILFTRNKQEQEAKQKALNALMAPKADNTSKDGTFLDKYMKKVENQNNDEDNEDDKLSIFRKNNIDPSFNTEEYKPVSAIVGNAATANAKSPIASNNNSTNNENDTNAIKTKSEDQEINLKLNISNICPICHHRGSEISQSINSSSDGDINSITGY